MLLVLIILHTITESECSDVIKSLKLNNENASKVKIQLCYVI